MFNPNPPQLPSATNDFWTPDEKYSSDVPFPVKESVKLTHKKHRFFQIFEIGAVSGSTGNNQQTIIPGLAVGASQTYDFDQIPDWYLIALSSESTARLFVYVGPHNTGIPIRLGAGGVITVPSLGIPHLTIVNRSATTQFTTPAVAFGTIIGHAGYDQLINNDFLSFIPS